MDCDRVDRASIAVHMSSHNSCFYSSSLQTSRSIDHTTSWRRKVYTEGPVFSGLESGIPGRQAALFFVLNAPLARESAPPPPLPLKECPTISFTRVSST